MDDVAYPQQHPSRPTARASQIRCHLFVQQSLALAHVLRTDKHLHRPLTANSDGALRVKALARQHQEAIWALHQTVSRLRCVLLEFYPQAIKVFPNLQHYAATAVLAAAPTPAAGNGCPRGESRQSSTESAAATTRRSSSRCAPVSAPRHCGKANPSRRLLASSSPGS